MALLNVDKLSVHFGDEGTPFRAVDRISYSVNQGEVVGIVGESGSGKSVSSLAIMGLIDYPGRGDDLPGPNDQPEPLLHRGIPDYGSHQGAPGRE